MRKTAGAVVAAAALGCSLAACGSSGSTHTATGPRAAVPSQPTGAVLADAYSATVGAKSADVSFTLTGQAAGKPITTTGSGVIGWASLEGEIHASVSAAGQSFAIDEVLTPTTVYVELPAQAQQAAHLTKPWIAVPHPSVGSSNGVDPRQLLSVLEAASNGVTRVGPATVGGVATTEYSATIDPSKLASDLSASQQALATKALQGLGTTAIPVKVWVDGAGQLVQLQEALTATLGGAAVSFSMTMDPTHYGVPVSVTPPPASEVGTLPTAPGGGTAAS